MHVPLTQVSGVEQMTLHPPQWITLEVVSTHATSTPAAQHLDSGVPAQAVRALPQMHSPPVQRSAVRRSQATLQPPQSAGLRSRSAQ